MSSAPASEVKIDRSNLHVLATQFGTYGYRPQQSVVPEADGLRFWLPAGVTGVGQTGIYSYFALAGDCEAVVTYELLHVPPPQKGYGAGVGLAFDVGDGDGRGSIQRVVKMPEGSGYALQTALVGAGGEMKEEYRFVTGSARRGKIGLKRVKKELIFLAADSHDAPLEEVDRLPFTHRTIGAVRVFADPGGSPTAVDVRVREIIVRAEEVAGGVPERDRPASRWWLWLAVPAAGGALFGIWWGYSRWSTDGAAGG